MRSQESQSVEDEGRQLQVTCAGAVECQFLRSYALRNWNQFATYPTWEEHRNALVVPYLIVAGAVTTRLLSPRLQGQTICSRIDQAVRTSQTIHFTRTCCGEGGPNIQALALGAGQRWRLLPA